MEKEYEIIVCMTPHPWDNKQKPYFWYICDGVANCGCGWSETPEEAWKDAIERYNRTITNRQ